MNKEQSRREQAALKRVQEAIAPVIPDGQTWAAGLAMAVNMSNLKTSPTYITIDRTGFVAQQDASVAGAPNPADAKRDFRRNWFDTARPVAVAIAAALKAAGMDAATDGATSVAVIIQ